LVQKPIDDSCRVIVMPPVDSFAIGLNTVRLQPGEHRSICVRVIIVLKHVGNRKFGMTPICFFKFLYLKKEMESFLLNEYDVLFIHIREIEEIKRFLQYTTEKGIACKTLLVTREEEKNKIYGNCADDMVEQYDYDMVYENNMPLEQTEKTFMIFFEKNVLK